MLLASIRVSVSDFCEDWVKPRAQSQMDIVKVCRKSDALRFSAITDCKFARRNPSVTGDQVLAMVRLIQFVAIGLRHEQLHHGAGVKIDGFCPSCGARLVAR
jgi:hypothetical protein